MKVSEMIKNVMDELMGNIKSGVETIEKAVAEDKALIVEISNRIDENFTELNAIETNTRTLAEELNAVADYAEDYHEDNAIYLDNLRTLVSNDGYNKDLADENYNKGYDDGYKDAEEDKNIEIEQLQTDFEEQKNLIYDNGYDKGYDDGYSVGYEDAEEDRKEENDTEVNDDEELPF
jgi:flagellar biosynthesis/type III secretory pathway protein FliH